MRGMNLILCVSGTPINKFRRDWMTAYFGGEVTPMYADRVDQAETVLTQIDELQKRPPGAQVLAVEIARTIPTEEAIALVTLLKHHHVVVICEETDNGAFSGYSQLFVQGDGSLGRKLVCSIDLRKT